MNVVDFFSGCGGASCGFRKAGCRIVAGVDNDQDAAATFALNFPEATIFNQDIRYLSPSNLEPLISNISGPLLFAACAPCQPFSRQNRQKKLNDERINLLGEFSRFVEYFEPDYIFLENVPGLQKYSVKDGPLNTFLDKLRKLNYPNPSVEAIYAAKYGVPQWRLRLIVIASKYGELDFPPPTNANGELRYATAREWIEDLPPLNAGESDPSDDSHRSARLSPKNLERIRNTPEGGSRKRWPKRLQLDCHKKMLKETGREGHSDAYGRLSFDKPASGLTTRCLSYSNGRFGHPTQDRAISLREAACLQTFPRDFRFAGLLNSRAKQVGNAVPPLLAERFANSFLEAESRRLKNAHFGDPMECNDKNRAIGDNNVVRESRIRA
jgi:DNA (cytosine-5)-methyltransferase 1